MAGGVGTRLWPVSRQQFPKQFQDVLDVGSTLLQMTFKRLSEVCAPENIYIISNADYESLIKEQLPSISDAQILSEPQLRNTAPCIAYAFHKISKQNPDANLIVAPADHLILDQKGFNLAVNQAFEAVMEKDILVTFGITPTRPDTGYGYIEFDTSQETHGLFKVKAFKEKPDIDTANAFLKAGNYVWNSGIFVWNIQTIRKSFENNLPEVNEIFEAGSDYYYSDQEKGFIEKAYSECINISVDYGILEKADNVHVIPVDFGWSDLGTWKSIFDHQEKDENSNYTQGQVFTYDTNNTLIKIPADKLAVVHGLTNFIVVEHDGVLMICNKDQEQMVKKFLNDVKTRGLTNYI